MLARLGVSIVELFASHDQATESTVQEPAFEVTSNLGVGAAIVDVTPLDLDVMEPDSHLRIVHGVRDPIMAGVMLLDNGDNKAAIVTLDIAVAVEEMVISLQGDCRDRRRSRNEHHDQRFAQPFRSGLEVASGTATAAARTDS